MPERSDTPGEDAAAARQAKALERALAAEAGEADAAAASPPAASVPAGEGRLRLDKSGALLGLGKLKPVLAHGRPEGPSAQPGSAGPAAPAPAPGPAPESAPDPAVPPRPGAPRKAALPPRIGTFVPAGFPGAGGEDEVAIPAGSFLMGEERRPGSVPAFRIDRRPVTHADYERFVQATGHRAPVCWPQGVLPDELRDHPVVGVDYFDALACARWQGKDLPFEDEWERAARGTDGRDYPWGDAPEPSRIHTAQSGLRMTVPVGLHPENETPEGVRDMLGNAWQMTHSPAPGGGIVVRGGSWFDMGHTARGWFRLAARPTARNGTIGFRCVRREAARPDAPREVPEARIEAEIAARRGPQPASDAAPPSADRRDLVLDARALKVFLAKRQVVEAVQAAAPPAPAPAPSAAERVHVPAAAPAARAPAPASPPASPVTTKVAAAVSLPGPVPLRSALPLAPWLVLGFALLLGMLAWLLLEGPAAPSPSTMGDDPAAAPGSRASEQDLLRLAPEPAPGRAARDGQPVQVVEGGSPACEALLARGTRLVVFAGGEEEAAAATRAAARSLHRRYGPRLDVVLVVPRGAVERADGTLGEPAQLERALASLGVTDGMTVVLDPPEARRDLLREVRMALSEPNAALLWADGVRVHQSQPPSGAMDLPRLLPLVERVPGLLQDR